MVMASGGDAVGEAGNVDNQGGVEDASVRAMPMVAARAVPLVSACAVQVARNLTWLPSSEVMHSPGVACWSPRWRSHRGCHHHV